MKKINKKYLFFAIVVLSVFMIILLINVFLFSKIFKISQDFINEKKVLEESAFKFNQLKIIEKDINIEDKLNEAYSFFNEPDKPIDNILFLNEIAEKNNVVIDINFNEIDKLENKKEGREEWSYLNFKVNAVTDNFSNLFNFLKQIELREKMTEIDRLKIEKIIQKKIDSGDSNVIDMEQIKAEISIKFYFLK